ncbi:MAG: xanthine dehydrogenase accessory protein XdhC [Steroidobacteraceae bacterium]|jgi:xanthine dehydrogenase accessory factor
MSARASALGTSAPAVAAGSLAALRALHDWPQGLIQGLQREAVLVRIVLAAVRGSAPREPGAVMLVGGGGIAGTIGGGQLEWQALAAARALLADSSVPARVQRLVLGSELAQCCGGVVELWLERYTRADLALLQLAAQAARRGPTVLLSTLTPAGIERALVRDSGADAQIDRLLRAPRAQGLPRLLHTAAGQAHLMERLDQALPPLWLFGAGHVGQALARILVELPVHLTWIDSRAELLPAQHCDSMQILHSADPVGSVAAAPALARFLVLTHSHPLDYALCRSVLQRGDFAWVGLIGSQSKAARFRARLAREGLSSELIARLVCPIGVAGIASKWPAAIAVGVAAQLLRDLAAEASLERRPEPAIAGSIDCGSERCGSCGATC